jgi:hypothetical protein
LSNNKGHFLLQNPPYTPEEAPEVCGAAFLKHYFNRITNTFLKEFTRVRGNILKSKVFERKSEAVKQAALRHKHAGESLQFAYSRQETDFDSLEHRFPNCIPGSVPELNRMSFNDEYSHDFDTEFTEPTEMISTGSVYARHGGWSSVLDPCFTWAHSNNVIAEALCRWQMIEEELVQECLPPRVIDLLQKTLNTWDGVSIYNQPKLDNCVKDLSESEAIMARLVITIAQNPSKISSRLTKQFLSLFPGDLGSSHYLGACSYAAFMAAKRIASFWNAGNYSSVKEESSSGSSDRVAFSSGSQVVQVLNCLGSPPPIKVIRAPHGLVVEIGVMTSATKAKIEGPYIFQRRTHFIIQLTYPPMTHNVTFSTMPHGTIDVKVNLPSTSAPLRVSDIHHERNGGVLELTFPSTESILDAKQLL